MATYQYQCTGCGAVTERSYPVGGAPPVLTDACETCTQFSSEHRRLPACTPQPPLLPGMATGSGPPSLRVAGC